MYPFVAWIFLCIFIIVIENAFETADENATLHSNFSGERKHYKSNVENEWLLHIQEEGKNMLYYFYHFTNLFYI